MKTTEEILDLGEHIVSQLGLENSIDILGRWMSHHLAELMKNAEYAEKADKREIAQEEAVELIIKLWDKRLSLPEDVNPLNHYSEAIKTLKLISSASLIRFSLPGAQKIDYSILELLELLGEVLIILLLRKHTSELMTEIHSETINEFYSDDEKFLSETLSMWVDFVFRDIDLGEFGSDKAISESEDWDSNLLHESLISVIDRLEKKIFQLKELLTERA